MKADLHMHSTCSDGVLSPRELVRFAASQGVTHMALTDHDTLEGVAALQGVKTEIPVLAGVELSIRGMSGLHLLGYAEAGVALGSELRSILGRLARERLIRARRMLEKLAALGMPLNEEALLASCGGTLGRMHIARAMVKAGYVRSPEEAFSRWIGDGGPAFVAGERLSMAEALELMRRSGFVPVLAHPAEIDRHVTPLLPLLEAWKKQGLMGVEVYHPTMAGRDFRTLDAMARRMGFLVTGGSDYHAEDGRHGQPGCTAACWQRAPEDVEALLRAVKGCAASAI